MKCSYCDWEKFNEEDGFYYCQRCNQQCEGFQLQVADDDHIRAVGSREVGRKRPRQGDANVNATKRGRSGKKKERPYFSKYTDVEARSLFYIGLVKDFVKICCELNPSFDATNFTRFAFKLLIKYFRESEIAYAKNENVDSIVKYYPKRTFRDKCLINKNTEDMEHLPFFETFLKRTHGRNDVRVSALTYCASRTGYQNQNYYDSQTDFKDSRLKSGTNWKFQTCRIIPSHMAAKRLLEAPRDNEADQLVDIVERAKNQNENKENDEYHEATSDVQETENRNLPVNDENEEDLSDEALRKRENQAILSQMSKKLRCMFPNEPVKFFSNLNDESIKTIDVFSFKKLVVLLYIAIRQWNIKLFFCDILRWINEGSLRMRFCIDWLPCNYEVTIRQSMYYQAAHTMESLNVVNRNLIFHLNLTGFEDPFETIKTLIERIIHDFNLPKGLSLLVMLRYKKVIDDLRDQKYHNIMHQPPKYDQVAMCLVVLTLRDLFTLDNPNIFWIVPRVIPNLFNINTWFKYSKIRLNAIYSHLFNMPVLNNNLILDPGHTHFCLRSEFEYIYRHKKQYINGNYKLKMRDFDNRSQLREQYEFLFGNNDYSRIDDVIKNMKPFNPCLYPLTAYTEYVVNHCQNDHVKSALDKDFRKKMITPYFFWNHDYFFQKQKQWTKTISGKKWQRVEQWTSEQHPIVRHLFHELFPIFYQSNMSLSFITILTKIDNDY